MKTIQASQDRSFSLAGTPQSGASLAFGSTELNRYDFENLEGTSIFL